MLASLAWVSLALDCNFQACYILTHQHLLNGMAIHLLLEQVILNEPANMTVIVKPKLLGAYLSCNQSFLLFPIQDYEGPNIWYLPISSNILLIHIQHPYLYPFLPWMFQKSIFICKLYMHFTCSTCSYLPIAESTSLNFEAHKSKLNLYKQHRGAFIIFHYSITSYQSM